MYSFSPRTFFQVFACITCNRTTVLGDGMDWMIRKMPSVLAQLRFCGPPATPSLTVGARHFTEPIIEIYL
jgi:hypothetical protein